LFWEMAFIMIIIM